MLWLGIRQEGLGDLKDTKRSSLAVAEREAIRLAKRKLKLEAQKSLRVLNVYLSILRFLRPGPSGSKRIVIFAAYFMVIDLVYQLL